MNASKFKRLSNLAKAAPLVAAVFIAASSNRAAAEVFTLGSAFTASGQNSFEDYIEQVTLAPGSTLIANNQQNLNLTISIVPVGDAAQDEWLVFHYQANVGLSVPDQAWEIDQTAFVGLDSDADAFAQFYVRRVTGH